MNATAAQLPQPNLPQAGLALARRPWLFSPVLDISVFLGSALLSMIALGVGHFLGVLHSETPDWAWVPFVLLLDVAHVYSTGFRVYFDRNEVRRRPLLYGGVPVICLVAGVLLYAAGDLVFWRVLAYLAVFHFVRQQYGWVALYRAKAGERVAWERRLDNAAIYLATVFPLAYWHAHLPRQFTWFIEQDFVSPLNFAFFNGYQALL